MSLENNKLLKIIPYLPAMIIIAGFLNQYVYYKEFGINISTYLEIGEILLLFSKDLLLFIVWTSVFVVIIFLRQKPQVEIEIENAEQLEHELRTSFRKRLMFWSKGMRPSFILMGCIFGLFLIWLIFWPQMVDIFMPFVLFAIVTLVFLIIKNEIAVKYYKLYNKLPDELYLRLATVTLFFYFSIYYYAIYCSIIAKTGVAYFGSSFKTERREYVCDRNHILVGQTHDYLFYFDKVADITHVIKRDDIVDLQVKRTSAGHILSK